MLSLILDDEQTLREMHFQYEESPVISHPCQCDGWQEMAEHAHKLSQTQGKNFLPLMIGVFVDGFHPENFRPDEMVGVYWTLFNFPAKMLNCTRHRYPLALVPANCDINTVLKHAVVEPLKKLEQGLELHRARLGNIHLCGSLYALLGTQVLSFSQ
jgi:hypothetical protein